MQSEDMPIFEQGGNWTLVRLLKGHAGVLEVNRKSLSQAFVNIFGDSGYKVLGSTFDGRQTGAKELQHMGVSIQSPARIGPENADIPGTMAMAGFPQSSYSLKREALLPPLELQRQVFPFIEGLHGSMDPGQWKAHCDRVMMDLSPFLNEETVQGAGRERRIAAAKDSLDVYSGVARLDLIHLLLWMRRIVLQDGALFLQDGATNRLLEHGVFRRAEFKKFQSDFLRAMGTHDGNSYQDQEIYREMSVSTSLNEAPSLSDSEAGQTPAGSIIEAPRQEEGMVYWVSHGNRHELRKQPQIIAESEHFKSESPPSQQQQLKEQVAALQRQVEEQARIMQQQMKRQEKERQQREAEYKRILDELSQQTRLAEELRQRLDHQQAMIPPRSPMTPPADGVAMGGNSFDRTVLDRTLHILYPPPGRVASSSVVSAMPEKTLHLQDLSERIVPNSKSGLMYEKTLRKQDPPGRAIQSQIPDAQWKQTRPMHGTQSGRNSKMSDPPEKSRATQSPPGPISTSKSGPTSPILRRRTSNGGATKRKSHIKWSKRPKTAIQITTQGAYLPILEGGFLVNARELYCLCREPDSGDFMIACDKCDGKFTLVISLLF